MSKAKKVLALVLALALVGGLVTGVAVWSTGLKQTQSGGGLWDGSKRIQNPGTMLTIGGNEISFEEYRYYYLTNSYYMSSGDPAFWQNDYDNGNAAQLKAETEQVLLETYTLLQLGKEKGIELTQEELDEIDASIESDRAELGPSFETRLAEMFIPTVDFYKEILTKQTLLQKIQAEYTETLKAEERDTLMKEAISAQHILILPITDEETAESPAAESTVPEETAESASTESALPEDTASTAESLPVESAASEPAQSTGDPMEAARVLADSLVAQLRASSDLEATFAQLREEYNNDPGQPENGYTFVEGDMVTPFYEAAKALKPGELSDPVLTDFGYHIILRMPLDEAAVEETLLPQAASYSFQTKMMELMDTLEIVPGEYYHLVSPANLR